jgi:hypothetical protein
MSIPFTQNEVYQEPMFAILVKNKRFLKGCLKCPNTNK